MGPLPQSHQVERAHWNNVEQPGDWTYNGDVNYTSLPGAAIASGSSLMQGSLAPVGQWNNVEQPGLTYGGLTYDGDLNYTSLPGAAIASGSSLMQGSLAPVGQGNNSEQPTPYNADQFRGVN
ncbi:hypothetical protein OIU79_019144 [Salix purpurea]|uniref:Uncharacterized protein n=1 Tax=Salix purpurea TaxID=77065 RepID=A0A9Q0P0M2_SALPP|nr:hypothetical protein OIU79_019144 [Salix purpurea]